VDAQAGLRLLRPQRWRATSAAAAAPNSRTIEGSGTSVPLLVLVLVEVVPLDEEDVLLDVLDDVEELVELDVDEDVLLLVELDVLTLPDEVDVDELVDTLPDEVETLPDDVDVEELVEHARSRMRAVHERLKAARAPRPRVAVIEWTDPIFAAGHWVPEMVRRAGGIDVLAEPGEHSTTRTLDQVRGATPQVILVAPCGFDLERAAADADRLLTNADWAWARETQVWALDANSFLSRPGPRVVDGIELLAQVLHTTLFGAPSSSAAQRLA